MEKKECFERAKELTDIMTALGSVEIAAQHDNFHDVVLNLTSARVLMHKARLSGARRLKADELREEFKKLDILFRQAEDETYTDLRKTIADVKDDFMRQMFDNICECERGK